MPHMDVGGVKLRYQLDGKDSAPVLVMSNSLGTALEMWDPQIPEFSKHYRVVRYDKRGHGQSDVPDGPYSFKMLAKDVVALMDGLGIEKADFCGLSMGGMTAQWLGAHAGDRFGKLLMCNTSANMGPPSDWDARIATVRKIGMEGMLQGVTDRWFTAEYQADEPDSVKWVQSMILATSAEGYAACCGAIRDMDHRDILPKIENEVLVIAGERDPATPPDHGRLIADGVAHGRLHVIGEAAHLSNIQKPDEFTKTALAFLTG